MPILLTYSALPKQNWWVHTVPWFSHTPVEVHHTECYSSVTHHAILKRVFSKYILNTWKEKRGNETKLLLIAAIRSQKNVEGCVLKFCIRGWYPQSDTYTLSHLLSLLLLDSLASLLLIFKEWTTVLHATELHPTLNMWRYLVRCTSWRPNVFCGLWTHGLIDSRTLTCYRTQMYEHHLTLNMCWCNALRSWKGWRGRFMHGAKALGRPFLFSFGVENAPSKL